MDCITRKAYAKINLALDVIRKREDGYHDVKMIMQTVGIFDELTFVKCKEPGISLKVDASDIPSDENNLICKAAKLLLGTRLEQEGVGISLVKTIPVAAGMAGGSTDAAATLLALNELFEVGKTKEELQKLAVTIGADIPYCIMGGTALSEGIGEKLTPLCMPPDCFLLIAKPDLYVSTQYVYQNLKVNQLTRHPDIDAMIQAIEQGDLEVMCSHMENVMETVTAVSHPTIEEIKQDMKKQGAINAIMSGSGPTVFGIYKEQSQAEKAKESLEKKQLAKQIFVTTFVTSQLQ